MKQYIKTVVLAILFAIAGIPSVDAQEDSRQISLAFLNESIAFPFTSYSEFHPGLELGVSLHKVEKEHSIRTVNTYAGWFLHQHIESAFFLRAEYVHEFKLGSRLRAGSYAGAGYMHTFYPGMLYEMDPQTGNLSATSQYGRPRALISAGIQISWKTGTGINPFIKQEFSVETPFANGIPVMPHSFLKIGITKNL